MHADAVIWRLGSGHIWQESSPIHAVSLPGEVALVEGLQAHATQVKGQVCLVSCLQLDLIFSACLQWFYEL